MQTLSQFHLLVSKLVVKTKVKKYAKISFTRDIYFFIVVCFYVVDNYLVNRLQFDGIMEF